MNFYKFILSLFLISFVHFESLYAQKNKLNFENILLDQGKSQTSVLAILQDSKGYIWIGTENGLNKYDGYRQTIYKNERYDSLSLSHNFIRTLYEDQSGVLWIGTRGGGLNRFDREKETFKHYMNKPDDPHSLSNNNVRSIYEDSSGVLWIGTGNGLNKYDRDNQIFTYYIHDPDDPSSLSNNSIMSIIEDKFGDLWVGTIGGGLNRFDREKELFIHFKNDPSDNQSISNDNVSSIYEDNSGDLWIGTRDGGLNKFDRDNQIFTYYIHDPDDPSSLSNNLIKSIIEDKFGDLWVGTLGGGLNQFDREKETFNNYQNDPNDPKSLNHNHVWCLFEDNSGIIWVGMLGGGLNNFNPEKKAFKKFQHNPNDINSLNNNSIWSFFEDHSGNLWIGTNGGGLNKFDRENGNFTAYKNDPDNPESISNNIVISIYEDKSKVLWVGTQSGLNKFDSEKEIFTHFKRDPNNLESISGNYVTCIYEDKSGILWIGTYLNGLNNFDPQNETFTHFKHDPNDINSLSDNFVFSLYEDSSGDFWIGTQSGGLDRFDREKQQFKHYQHNPLNSQSLSNNSVSFIYEDQSGILWVGTEGGLNKYDKSIDGFKHYRVKDGLPSDVLRGVLEDDSGHLWLSTIKGLSKFRVSDSYKEDTFGMFRNYDDHVGLNSSEFNSGAYLRTRNGEFFFGGEKGFNTFYPEKIIDNIYISPIVITDFQVFYKSIPIFKGVSFNEKNNSHFLNKHISETNEIILSHRENVLTFEFAALDYDAPERNKYAYMMEGFDKDWIKPEEIRFATYTSLYPGEYILKVVGSNSDGVWNEVGTSIAITITPPWWETWWAYTFYIVSLVGSILGYIRFKTDRHTKALAQEQRVTEGLRRVDKLKDEFLANTSHELRTPLNGIIGLTESLIDGATGKLSQKTNTNLGMVVTSGKRLARLVDNILDFSKLKTQNLKLNNRAIDLRILTDIVLRFSESLLNEKKISLKNNIPKSISLVKGDSDRIQQIMHNLIGNSIKFSEKGEIEVTAQEINEFVEISVSDQGIGIPSNNIATIFQSFEQVNTSIDREYGGSGLGLSITRKLVTLHGGTIKVESKLNYGSTFKFTIPKVKKNAGLLKADLDSELLKTNRISKVTEEGAIKFDKFANTKKNKEVIQILVVDDEPINHQVIVNYLSSENYSVTKAMNGKEALKIINSGKKFDLVLMDLMMPKMSGYEVCQIIREKFLPTELPVIVITAKDQVSDLVHGFACGANDYLSKPFSKHEFLARIKTHLNLFKINHAFGRFVPHEFLRSLGKESLVEVGLGDQIQGEMTIMFSDIRSYSALAESMPPKEVFNFLNGFLGRIGPIIRENFGFVNQFYGDGIMGVFKNMAEDAIKSAVEMQKKVAEYNRERINKGRKQLKIGIGLHTGPLTLGIIGDQLRMDTAAVADSVNIASRMEGLTKFYGASIVLSEQTLKAIENPDQYNHRFLGKVQVKGRESVMAVYEFFDGDSEKIIKLKIKTKSDFEQGLKCYFSKAFEDGAVYFKKVLNINPDDKTAQLYFNHSAKLMVQDVPDNWEGIEVMDRKS